MGGSRRETLAQDTGLSFPACCQEEVASPPHIPGVQGFSLTNMWHQCPLVVRKVHGRRRGAGCPQGERAGEAGQVTGLWTQV